MTCYCGNEIKPPRRKHCSLKCGNRAAYAAYLERKRTGVPSSRTREPIVPGRKNGCWTVVSRSTKRGYVYAEASCCGKVSLVNGSTFSAAGPFRTCGDCRAAPAEQRVCRWCGRSTAGQKIVRECSACNRQACRRGRDATGRPLQAIRRPSVDGVRGYWPELRVKVPRPVVDAVLRSAEASGLTVRQWIAVALTAAAPLTDKERASLPGRLIAPRTVAV